MTDLYAILGVLPGSDEVVIQAAYRALMRKFHPDANPSPEALRRSANVNAAFAILGDPTRRAAYDASRSPQGHDAETGSDSKLIARVPEANSSDRVESNDEPLHAKPRPQRRKNNRTRYGWRAADEDIVESERQLAAEERREARERRRRVSNWALGIFGACLVGAVVASTIPVPQSVDVNSVDQISEMDAVDGVPKASAPTESNPSIVTEQLPPDHRGEEAADQQDDVLRDNGNCRATVLHHVTALQTTEDALEPGETYETITQFWRNTKTGATWFCAHGSACYPATTQVEGREVSTFRLENCQVQNPEPDPFNNDSEEVLYRVGK